MQNNNNKNTQIYQINNIKMKLFIIFLTINAKMITLNDIKCSRIFKETGI